MNLLTSPTLPTNGTNEVQRLTLTGAPTGGTFKLRFGSSQTAGTLPYNASAAAIQTALRALPTIGASGVTCSGGALGSAPVDVTFGGILGRKDVLPIQVVAASFVGGTSPALTQSTVTPGVEGTQRSAVAGQILLYGTEIYFNHGTPYAPDWRPYAPAGISTTIVTKATSYALTAADSGKTFRPTAGGVVFTLPVLADNLLYTFLTFRHPVNAADAMTVQPQASDHVVDPSNSIGNTSTGIGIRDTFGDRDGYSIQLLGVAGQGWVVVGGVDLGSWEPAT
jgi:hypothetical protein